MTIQPTTLCSAAFWQNSRPVSSQKREERKKLQSVTASLALARPAMGVNRYISQSTRPSAASASTASVVLTLAAAEIRKGQSRAPQA